MLGMPGWAELALLAAGGLLLFGKRLPQLARTMGRGIVEFKKGLSGMQEEIEKSGDTSQPPKQAEQNGSATFDEQNKDIPKDTSQTDRQ
jgi:sec-independent protein translocase protein TatA